MRGVSEEIPAAVLAKLDACDLQLTLEEWQSLPGPARERLAALSVDQRIAKRAFAGFVIWLRDTFLSADS